MDRSLSQEIKRRLESTQTIKQECEQKIRSMEERLNNVIDERIDTVQIRICALEQKVDDLNTRFQEEHQRIPKDIEVMGKELETMVTSLQGKKMYQQLFLFLLVQKMLLLVVISQIRYICILQSN